MNILPLAIPLTAVLTCSNLSASAFASRKRFALNASTDLLPLSPCDLGLGLILFAHGPGFPLTDTSSHQLWAVGFPNIDPIHEEVEHSHIAAVVIHLKPPALEP